MGRVGNWVVTIYFLAFVETVRTGVTVPRLGVELGAIYFVTDHLSLGSYLRDAYRGLCHRSYLQCRISQQRFLIRFYAG
jgi:hypothetical protein